MCKKYTQSILFIIKKILTKPKNTIVTLVMCFFGHCDRDVANGEESLAEASVLLMGFLGSRKELNKQKSYWVQQVNPKVDHRHGNIYQKVYVMLIS